MKKKKIKYPKKKVIINRILGYISILNGKNREEINTIYILRKIIENEVYKKTV